MQIALKCKISLSKKMRTLLQNGGSIVLTSNSINSGKGDGTLVISDNGNKELDVSDLINKETSIMITPVEVSQGVGNASVSNIYNNQRDPNPGVSNVFSNNQPQQGHQTQRNVIDRMAATQPPEQGQNNRAYYAQDELTVPKEFNEFNDDDFLSYVKNYQELVQAVKESQSKVSDINVSPVSEFDSMNERKNKALLMEQKEKQESIGCDAYIVNEQCASLVINDIGLDLPLNMPKNLGNISARKIASSRDLWKLLKTNKVRIISPNEADHLLKNAGTMTKTYVPELEIYDSRYDAQEEIYEGQVPRNHMPNADVIDLDSPNNQQRESEEMRNLIASGRPSMQRQASGGNVSSLSGGTRRTFHGSGGTDEPSLHEIYSGNEWEIGEDKRKIGRESRRNSAGIHTVASRHSRRR
jgi:hypothetical protein